MTDAVRQYRTALRSTYVSRDGDECGRTYNLVDEDAADAAIAELKAERDAAVRERDIWRDMYRHSVRPVCGGEMAYEAQMKYDREASRARPYTKQRREETWADSPPIETEDGYV
jgi:hypothetical protein